MAKNKKNRKEKEVKVEKEVKEKTSQEAPEEKGVAVGGHIVITKSSNPNAHWYVIHTYSGHEAKVAEALRQRVETMSQENKILEVLIPTQETVQIRSGKKLNVTEKIFPGYLLIRMILDDSSWLTVRTTPGVTGFVGVGNKPTPISNDEVKAIQKFMDLGAPKFKVKFTTGEAVKIIDGPFAEFLGSIESIDEEKGRVQVLVSIFGRETPVELDFLQISKI